MKINVFLHDSFKTHRPVIISSEFQSTKGEMLIEYWMEIKLFLFTSFNLECSLCGALRWKEETNSICCNKF